MTTAMPTQGAPDEQHRSQDALPRTLRSDLEWLRAQVVEAIEARPLTAAATAAAIGFVLGGGLTRPMLGLLIQTGSRVAANRLGAVLPPQGSEDDFAAEGSAHD